MSRNKAPASRDVRTIRSLIPALFASAATLALACGGTAWAASTDLWQSSANHGDYFLKDNQTGDYVETINCNVAFRFKFNKSTTGGIRLYDASRDIYVQLDGKTMWLHTPASGKWAKFKTGGFDRRIVFTHTRPDGGITGDFWKKPGCVWQEFLGGTARPDFTFRQLSLSSTESVMLDSSRGMYAKLMSTAIFLRKSPSGNFSFFKKGGFQGQ